jgi:PBP1b-binding outer membrane lipoprotein LpoB
MTKMRTVSIALASLVLLAGCTTDGGNPSDAPMGNSTQSQSTGENMPQVSGAANEAPTITAPTGNPPQELVTEDVITGSGATAEANSTLTVHYTLMAWSTGEVVESSWSGEQHSA